MKKYRVTSYGEITEREVVKETKSSVTYEYPDLFSDRTSERREMKSCDGHCWFDSWQECKDWLIANAEADYQAARRALQRAQDKLGNAKGLKQKSEKA